MLLVKWRGGHLPPVTAILLEGKVWTQTHTARVPRAVKNRKIELLYPKCNKRQTDNRPLESLEGQNVFLRSPQDNKQPWWPFDLGLLTSRHVIKFLLAKSPKLWYRSMFYRVAWYGSLRKLIHIHIEQKKKQNSHLKSSHNETDSFVEYVSIVYNTGRTNVYIKGNID